MVFTKLKEQYENFIRPLKLMDIVSKQSSRNPLVMFRYLTIWAFIIHVLYRIGIFRMNTFALGMFVFVGSIILMWFYPGYYTFLYKLQVTDPDSPYYHLYQYKHRYIAIIAFYDIILHYLPMFLLVVPVTNVLWLESFAVLFTTILVYLVTIGTKYAWKVYYYLLDPVNSVYLDI